MEHSHQAVDKDHDIFFDEFSLGFAFYQSKGFAQNLVSNFFLSLFLGSYQVCFQEVFIIAVVFFSSSLEDSK